MRPRGLAMTMILGAMLGAAEPAAAGGSWLETQQSFYSPGELAIARDTFSSGQLQGSPADGPYYAYLVPGYRWFPKPGPVPDYAIPLGSIAIAPATGNYCCWVATLKFTVPDAPAGRYSIDYCNDPCTVNGIGDLMGGSFFIGESEEEARLMGRIERLEAKAEALQQTKRQLRKAETALTDARVRYDQLIGRLRAARPEASASTESGRSAERPVEPWAVAAGLGALLVGAWFRRRGLPAIPDVIPSDLVRQFEAQVPSRQPMTSVGRPVMSMPAPPLTKS